MSAGFTPGPWEMRPAAAFEGEWEINKPSPDSISGSGYGEPWFIALVHDGAEGVLAETNARLIAAAPELYEALEDAATTIRIMAETAEDLQMNGSPKLREREAAINAVLAKARGEA